MKKIVNPKETTRAQAFELWMKAPNPMVTLSVKFVLNYILFVHCIFWHKLRDSGRNKLFFDAFRPLFGKGESFHYAFSTGTWMMVSHLSASS